MPELFIPTLHTFAMNNIFTGSWGLFRFRAAPKVVMATPKEVDFAQSSICAEYWHGWRRISDKGTCDPLKILKLTKHTLPDTIKIDF